MRNDEDQTIKIVRSDFRGAYQEERAKNKQLTEEVDDNLKTAPPAQCDTIIHSARPARW
jgi:hypothetical protein